MLKSVKIRNFQSHQDTTIDLHTGVNVFVGLSNSGKTSIVRSINWVDNNRPLGDGIIRRGTKETSVEIISDNGSVLRNKNKSNNEYIINGDVDHPLTAFGSEPPTQISDTLRLTDINLQRQFEPYFLVFDPPGQAATYVRSITKLDEIDVVIDKISSRIRKNSSDIENTKTEIEDLKPKLDEVNKIDLAGLINLISKSESTIRNLDETSRKLSRLRDIISQIKFIKQIEIPEDADHVISESNKICEMARSNENKTSRLLDLISRITGIVDVNLPDSTNETIDRCLETSKLYNETCAFIKVLKNTIESIREIDNTGICKINPNETLILSLEIQQKYNTSDKSIKRISELVDRIKSLECEIGEISTNENIEIKQMDEIKMKLTECPTCGQAIGEHERNLICSR